MITRNLNPIETIHKSEKTRTLRNTLFRKISPFFILLLLLSTSALAFKSGAKIYKPFPASWQKILDETVKMRAENFQIAPGAFMLIKSPGWGIRIGHAGVTNLNQPKPAGSLPPAMLPYRIGSMTKIFTAITILQMEQEGLLKLTDPVDKYLKGDVALKLNGETVTVAHCMQMTSGSQEYLSDPMFASYPFSSPAPCSPTPCGREFPPSEIMGIVNKLDAERGALFEPNTFYSNPFSVVYSFMTSGGDPAKVPTYDQVMATTDYQPVYPQWHYTSSNYIMLGLIIEAVSGNKAEAEVKKRIFDPLGMTDTLFPNTPPFPPNTIQGYSKFNSQGYPFDPPYPNWVNRTNTNPSYAWTAGAIISTQWDLLRFLEAVYTEETLINQATRQKYLTFVSGGLMGIGNMSYGVGACMQDNRGYGTMLGHGGIFTGYRNIGFYLPSSDTTFITMANTSDSYEIPDDNPYDLEGGSLWPEFFITDQVMPLVFAPPTTPHPTNKAKGVAITSNDDSVMLKAQPGRVYGDSYEVYFGTNENDLKKVASAPTPKYLATALNRGATYYWRMDAKTGTTVYEGPVWSFTTK